MPTITFDAVSKSYATNTVIDQFTAEVPDKEFIVLLGPSGCGKSTMLRMIAGLTPITHGQLRFDGAVVNDLAPKRRNVAFVFQSYALYPHMSVRANIAFPLVMDETRWWHHIPIAGGLARRAIARRPDIAQRVEAVAATLELDGCLDRRPRALSGGQRQRVALARSLVREPDLYLLDEPLSNLDAKLRAQMRTEIAALHARVEKTFVYVTHDQVEAMTMADRIMVLNDGVVQQYAAPDEIYDRPANTFVASFIGSPPMTLLPATVDDSGLVTAGQRLAGTAELAGTLRADGRSQVRIGIRPEHIAIEPAGGPPTPGGLAAIATTVERLGAETVVGFKLGDREDHRAVGASATRGLHHARIAGATAIAPGDHCYVAPDLANAVLFDDDTGHRIDH